MNKAQILDEDDPYLKERIAEDGNRPLAIHWLSFCDPDLPIGSTFLGVAIVKARGLVNAGRKAWTLGINPGGEILGTEIRYSRKMDALLKDSYDRLLTKEEATALNERLSGLK